MNAGNRNPLNQKLPLVTTRVEHYPQLPTAQAGRFVCVGPYVLTVQECEELIGQLQRAVRHVTIQEGEA